MSERVLRREEYIRASADQVWRALTDPEVTARYAFGGARVQSTWRVGDEIHYLTPDGAGRLLEGTLLEVERGRRLVLSCRFLGDPRLAADRPHRETFEIEDLGELCKLTATFDHYAPDSPAYQHCALGMAMTGSSLKSLLETGAALAFAAPD
ncbi:MAG TPA: SRPBCC domain-containing protein [Thermomicrobiales bacterium]|nr:SRPBCC domain-containing protein [Thermomicrobiales bacterium]